MHIHEARNMGSPNLARDAQTCCGHHSQPQMVCQRLTMQRECHRTFHIQPEAWAADCVHEAVFSVLQAGYLMLQGMSCWRSLQA